jgi:hypothetical protein
MSQWEPHGLLDSNGWILVEREGLFVPHYWHQRVLSQVPDFDEGVCPRRRCRH